MSDSPARLLADVEAKLEHAYGSAADTLAWVASRLRNMPAPSTGAVIPSRRSDPDTSRKAEPTPVKAGTQRARLLAAFALPEAADGLTDEEAADLADGVPYRSEFAKRCSELRQAGLIAVVPHVTRPGVAGHQRIVSAITPAGCVLSDKLAERRAES